MNPNAWWHIYPSNETFWKKRSKLVYWESQWHFKLIRNSIFNIFDSIYRKNINIECFKIWAFLADIRYWYLDNWVEKITAAIVLPQLKKIVFSNCQFYFSFELDRNVDFLLSLNKQPFWVSNIFMHMRVYGYKSDLMYSWTNNLYAHFLCL